jgi:predicted phosphodiesterase
VSLANDVDYAVGVGAVRDLLLRSGIEPSEVGQLHRIKDVKLYQGMAKVDLLDSDGNPNGQEMQVKDLVSVVLSPKWETGPDWPVAQQGPSFKLPPVNASGKKTSRGDWKTAVIVPDMQIGFYTGKDGQPVPTHDPVAIDLFLSITKSLDPDMVVMVGDNLDLPEFGKYRLSPAFAQTSQQSIDGATELCFRVRAAAPHAEIKWLAGNHEERLANYLLDNARAAFGLRKGATPEGWPVLSVPFLCRLDESGVDYLEGYPANEFWLNERLHVIHGDRVMSNGSTAHKYLAQQKTSVLYGHVHRREWAERTFKKWDGAKTIMAASPGTLAKIDGSVPSTKGSIDLHGRPLTVVEDWQQGIGIVTYETEGEHRFFYEQIPFHGGTAMFRGKLFESAK